MPQLDPSAFWGIAGILAGFVVATFFFFIGKNKKILEYQITFTPLITEKMSSIPGINITIHEQPVKNLVSTAIRFTNVGNQTIVSSDFASRDPLGISLIGHLYSYDVTADNKNITPLLKVIDGKVINIKFEFLKPKQSFTVTMLHEGGLDNVFGELKTGKIRFTTSRSFLGSKLHSYFVSSIFILVAFTAYFCFFSNYSDILKAETLSFCTLLVGIIGILAGIFFFFD